MRLKRCKWVLSASCVLAVIVAIGWYTGYYHLLRAYAASWHQDWASVRHYAERHLTSVPHSQQGRVLLARSFRETGDWNAAQRSYEQLRVIPIEDLIALSRYYKTSGQIKRHLETAQSIHQRVPDRPDNLIDLAEFYQQRGDLKQAGELFTRVTEVAPMLRDGWVGLGYSHLDFKDPNRAAECFRKALNLSSGQRDWELRRTLAGTLLVLAQLEEAETQLKQSLEARPDDAHTLWMLSDCMLQQSPPRLEEAVRYAEEALSVDPSDRRTRLLLARLAVYEGNWKEAIEHLNVILEKQTRDPEALRLLKVCQRMHQRDESSSGIPFQAVFSKTRIPVKWAFTEVSKVWDISFRHTSGENKKQRYYPESLGSGVAVFDFDNDGHLDVYFVTSSYLGDHDHPDRALPKNSLFRNVGNGKYVDVTQSAGVGDTGFGHGVSVADYDNDGDRDVYVTNYGRNVLYRNNADGSFSDVSEQSGVADSGMSTSAAWFDYNEDGNLDLYVCNYAKYDITNPVLCTVAEVGAIYCSPEAMPSQRDVLYCNQGDGTFRDVTHEMGIARDESPLQTGKGLGVITTDFNGDGHVDIFVANDGTPNFLFRGDGQSLEDVSDYSGVDLDKNGQTEACMGVDAGDVDGDGTFEILVTNDWTQKNTLYRNAGELLFHDVSDLSGLDYGTKLAVGWGTALIDMDNDGDLDNFVTNGHYNDWQAAPFRQGAMLWSNQGDGTFEDVSKLAGSYFHEKYVGRGAAFGDLNNDGRMDIVLNHWNDDCEVLLNDTDTEGSYLRLQLIGKQSNRDGIGVQMEVRVGARLYFYQQKGGGSYLSANDLRPLIGLGRAEQVDQVRVVWPSGIVQEFENISPDTTYRLVEGNVLERLF